ncbi:F-box protein [Quillaja saponaria]|uniref:F-box protein n=1 Tax=Quillaja saponaria TaxID=32244 RepID=A0AAD7QJD7_QUISA|nr:F-box protein [Quillaja saponaria]
MDKSGGIGNAAFLKIVEKRALSKKKEETLVPYLPKDCVSNILSSIPIESPQTFSVEAKYLQSTSVPVLSRPILDPTSMFCIQFVEFKDGKSNIKGYNISCLGKIRATCNGLILLDNKLKKGALVVLNPVTRKQISLPVGTIYPTHDESYGFAFSSHTGKYKVIHLFRDKLGFVSCEILNLETRCWREFNGPSFGLFGWFGYEPVSAIGALHWVPKIDHNDFIVSIEVDEEKFHTIVLPKSSRIYDGLVEINGYLGFVTHEAEVNHIDIWILKGITGEVWIKHHSITAGCILDMVPLMSLRINEEMIFKRDENGSFYSYDFKLQLMRKVEMENGCFPLYNSHLPHVNSLVAWSSGQK